MRRLPILVLLLSLLPSSPPPPAVRWVSETRAVLTWPSSGAPSLDLQAPATVGEGDVFEVVASVYAEPQTLTLLATGGAALDPPTWHAPAAPGFPQIHTWRVRAGDGEKVVVTAGDARAVTNIRRPQVGACGQIGCYLQFAPWVGRG